MESVFSKFILGGLAGMGATCIVQPIDLIKTRMQLSGELGKAKEHKSSLHALINIGRQEGVRNLYKGLSAALLRQATYTTTRLGVYSSLIESFSQNSKGEPVNPSFLHKLAAGCIAGGVGAVVGTPAEVALIRMTSDGRLPLEQRRNYKNVFEALYRITKEEGVLTMWRGCSPTIVRAVILNAAQLAGYSKSKELLFSTGYFSESIQTHFLASLSSGFFATAVSIPVDMVKTRIQTMKIIDGKPQYSGPLNVLSQTIATEGVFSLWKGFTPYFLRLGPHTILTFIFFEQMTKYFFGESKL